MTKRKRQQTVLTSLKAAIVGGAAIALVWLVSWFLRTEWLVDAQAEAAAATATPRPTETRETILVLPTVAPLPTERPTFEVRAKPALATLPTPMPSFTPPSLDTVRAVPTLAPVPRSDSGGAQQAQMPELQPIPDMPAPPPPPPPSSGGGGGGGSKSQTGGS